MVLMMITVRHVCGEEQQPADSVQLAVRPPDTSIFIEKQTETILRHSALKATGLSLLIPGSGQVYTHHPIKGGLFLGAEIICAASLFGDRMRKVSAWREDIAVQSDEIDSLTAAFTLSGDTMVGKKIDESDLSCRAARFNQRQARYSAYHNAGFLIGLHLWNVMDALENSRQFANDETRKPALAACLSMIPCLGLGQIYNGSYSKAGMIWMMQTMLLAVAIDHNRLMQYSTDERAAFLVPGTRESALKGAYLSQWDDNYNQEFTQRNTFLWYAVFFYMYSIFDAMVDAHLHDYRQKIKLDPGFNPATQAISFQMTFQIGRQGDFNKRNSLCR
jgi:hypothetical protein